MRRPLLFLLVALPLAAAGCMREEPKIESYDVPQPNREKMRMLTAIVPADKVAYVVKLAGPDAEVADQQQAFTQFVDSIRLDDQQKPTWKTPAGWKEEEGGGEFRIASFRIAAPRPIEVAVTRLPPLGDAQNTLLDNVNRWRGQLNLPLAEPAELDQLVERRKVDGRNVIVADMSGAGVYHEPAKVLAAPNNPHAGMPAFPGVPNLGGPKLGKGNLPFVFVAPDAWKPLRPLPQFSSEAYEVIDGKQRAKITISMVQGDVLPNVARWRDMIRLPHAKDAEIEKDIRRLRVAGMEAHYVDLANSRATVPDNRILGVIVPTQGTNCFIKMSGPDELVGRQKTNFEAFVESFKLE